MFLVGYEIIAYCMFSSLTELLKDTVLIHILFQACFRRVCERYRGCIVDQNINSTKAAQEITILEPEKEEREREREMERGRER
jgi:hypothetical protein